MRELEEQIESDDRAERLEVELQHTQDRAAELEFQVSKLKQVCALSATARYYAFSTYFQAQTTMHSSLYY